MWTSKAPILLYFIRLFDVDETLRFTCYAVLFIIAIDYLLSSIILNSLCLAEAIDFTTPSALMDFVVFYRRLVNAWAALG